MGTTTGGLVLETGGGLTVLGGGVPVLVTVQGQSVMANVSNCFTYQFSRGNILVMVRVVGLVTVYVMLPTGILVGSGQ